MVEGFSLVLGRGHVEGGRERPAPAGAALLPERGWAEVSVLGLLGSAGG